MNATVVITTRNRREELRKAVQSALMQDGGPQVLVIDDGSSDGTSQMIRDEFPSVTLHRDEQSRGLIVQRNRGAELASGEIILSIDDDAAFSTPDVVRQTLVEFDHPRVGAVGIPFINVRQNNLLLQRAPGETGIFVRPDYVGTAHAVRRELFLRFGGYHGYLLHQGEEQDFCVRMLDHGYVVRLGRADPILHHESPRRDVRRMDLYGRRNDVLYVWYNAPWHLVPMYMLGTSVQGVVLGLKLRRPFRMIRGLLMGWAAIFHEWFKRNPVSTSTFLLARRMRRQPNGVRLEQIETELKPLA